MNTSKIIKGVVGGGRYTVTAPIIKEDYGLYLKIEGLELPSTYEVDFSNDEHSGTSVTMIGNSDGVLIPNQFISSGKDVFAFLYHVGADYGRTVYKFRIPNKLRPDRTDETPTPEQASTIDQAIAALNEAVDKTAQDVIDADASAQNASADAERAEEARTDAQNYATQAEQSATDAHESASQASASATASANSASQSAQIKSDVEGMVDDAQASADLSGLSARSSGEYASQARGFAQSASTSATNAQGYASNAQTSANTASTKASEASQSAQAASQKATEASQSASNAQGYAQTAESAKTDAQTAQGLAESARDTAVQAKNDAESARDEAQNLVDGISGKVEQIDSNTERIESLEDDRYKPYATDSASGSIAYFPDGADGIPLKSLVVDINPVQDLHGQDSPYPAGGGKNKFDPAIFEENDGVLQTDDGSYYFYSLSKLLNKVAWDSGGYDGQIAVTLIRKCEINRQSLRLYINYTDGTNKGVGTSFATGNFDTYTVVSDASKTVSSITFDYGSNLPTYAKVQVELGSTATSYAPYENICPISGWTEVDVNHSDADMTNPTTIAIDLGQTVYGGKLDVLSGKLVVDRAMVDLGAINWRYNVGGTGAFDTRVALTPLAKSNTKCICSQYKTLAYPNQGNITNSDFCIAINKKDDGTAYTGTYVVGALVVKDIRYSDVDTFKTAMSGVMLCYELAEPIEIQLSANQLNSLYGQNNIWADTGDSEVEYRADTKLYIEKLTQPEEYDMVADSAITSGQFFMVGNTLYKALTAIASGASITIGTNAQRVSLADALNLVNA